MLEFLPKPARQFAGGIGKIAILILLILYIVSPIDFLPEALLGPIGLIDDVVAIGIAAPMLGFASKAKQTKESYKQLKK